MSEANDTRLERIGNGSRKYYGVYRCSCPAKTVKEIYDYSVRDGLTKSCGCLAREVSKALLTKHGHCPWKGKASREHVAWSGAKDRCSRPNNPAFGRYGGRGITVCSRWSNDFQAFLDDMGACPSGCSLDRRDNDKGYWCGKAECPECGPAGREPNCRWATRSQQNRNQRSNVNLTYKGKTQCLQDWADELGFSPDTLIYRIRKGWSVEDAFTRPLRVWGKKT